MVFPADDDLSERVIFPITDAQANGIEDARFVQFEDAGQTTFYATYTAYSGRAIRSELLETTDFRSFRMTPLAGTAARNKGMALFPRRIDGRYAMIARQDNENLYLIYSDDLYTWDGGRAILQPEYPWEFVQIGSCGSPIELDDCWLLLTHGVGPVRKYSIGAVLLDKKDPSKVLARSREPLVRPEPAEREGYVPNVVYTCGAMRHRDQIILPYAVSDTFSNFATIKISRPDERDRGLTTPIDCGSKIALTSQLPCNGPDFWSWRLEHFETKATRKPVVGLLRPSSGRATETLGRTSTSLDDMDHISGNVR